MADTKLAKVGITLKERWAADISYEPLDFALWRTQDGGDGRGYIAKKSNINVLPTDGTVWIPATEAGQSIYDLAVRYGKFVGTEEEFVQEYYDAVHDAQNAAAEAEATNTEVQEAENLRKSAENARVAAETARETHETARMDAESNRVAAENQRANAEVQRNSQETARQSAENARQTAEQGRQSAEQGRQSAETARENAEQERRADFEALETDMQNAIHQADEATHEASQINNEVKHDEQLRQQAEQGRVEAERGRVQQESARQTSENARQAAETNRSNAETNRVNAETARGEAESSRQTAEQGRESAESQRAGNESTRQSNESARQSAETARSEAEQARQGAESTRESNEQTRQTQEGARQSAEQTRAQNEQTRQTQEGSRQTAETARANAESARATAENARKTAETGRVNAETARANAETARQTAETARETQATTDHQRAEGDHAIAAEDHATLDEKISHKADIDGSYDGMAVGIARNLEGRTDVTGSFFERTTGGDAEVANGTAQLNEVKGKSQVWNQLVAQNMVSGGTSKNVTYSISAGKLLLQTTADGVDGIGTVNIQASWIRDSTLGIKQITGHLYYSPKTLPTGFWFSANAYTGGIALCSGTITTGLAGSSENGQAWSLRATGGTKVLNQIECPIILFDLTLLGIDNLTTVEEVEAWLAENIGEQAYYPYNEGEVLNNRMTGVESIGFNLLDPATGKADIIGAYSDVYGNYYGITGTHGTLTFTDKFGNSETITPDEDGKFLLETAGTLSVADAGEDCAVFLWWDGTQTEYKPYEKNVGALDVTHIYGKLNGEGDYVRVWPTGMPGIGDIKDTLTIEDGTVVAKRAIGEVDCGTKDYTMASGVFYFTESTGKPGKDNAAICLCAKYPFIKKGWNEFVNGNYDKVANLQLGSTNCYLEFKDSAYENGADFKAAMSGVMVYYELATPQVFTDLIYRDSEAFADNTPVALPVNYKVDNWGIERIAPQNTEEAVVTTKPELTMRYSIDAVEELNTHRDEIDDLYGKNEELDARKPEKYGEYPDMAVGSAKTLAGNDTKVEDFFFKALDCADGLAKLNSARGKSFVMNQLIKVVEGTLTNQGVTITKYGNGEINFSGLATSSGGRSRALTASTINTIVGHKYYRKTNKKGDGRIDLYEQYPDGTYRSFSYNSGKIVVETESKTGGYIGSNLFADENYNTSVFVFMVDLTLMFGAGNEPATPEEFEAMFPLPYYDYNEGEIISNKTEEVKVVGFNQWDEEWESGIFNTATGVNLVKDTQWRCKNLINVLPNSRYRIGRTGFVGADFVWVMFYDAGKNIISPLSSASVGGNNMADNSVRYSSGSTIITPANAAYIKFYTTSKYAPPYQNDICINFSDPARNGEYEPYKTNTIELNLPTLTGKLNGEGESVVVFPDGLKSAGSAYDEIVGNKAIKRVGVVDMGTLSGFYKVGTAGKFQFPKESNGLKTGVSPLLCTKYRYVPNMGYSGDDGTITDSSISNSVAIISDSNNASTSALDFKATLSGVLLYYELATPEEYILDAPLPDTFQAYKGGTIKQLPENGSAPTTAPMVMTVTYAIDAVGTLVGLPRNYVSKESLQAMLNAMQSAGIIASYTMAYNENTGKYDFTFVAPTNS